MNARAARLAAGQVAVAILSLLALAFEPFGRPQLLLIPTAAPLGAAIDLALARDARLVGPGPIRRSVRVTGDAAAMIGPLLRQGTIVIGVPAVLCTGRGDAGATA